MMNNELLLPKLAIERVDSESGRYYVTPNGNRYKSVTTWLARTSDSSALDEWRAAVGDEEANRVSRNASNRGTSFHNLVEHHLRGDPLVFGKNILLKEQFRLFKPVLAKVSNIRGIEYQMYSDILKLAGTCDLIASYDNTPSIIDWKTSTHPKNPSQIENYWLQLSIYSMMLSERFSIHIPQLVLGISVDNMAPQVLIGRRTDWMPELARRIKQYGN